MQGAGNLVVWRRALRGGPRGRGHRLQERGFEGTQGAEGPTGAIGVLILDGRDEPQRSQIVALRQSVEAYAGENDLAGIDVREIQRRRGISQGVAVFGAGHHRSPPDGFPVLEVFGVDRGGETSRRPGLGGPGGRQGEACRSKEERHRPAVGRRGPVRFHLHHSLLLSIRSAILKGVPMLS